MTPQERLIDAKLLTPYTAEIAIRGKFKCEYCGLDFLLNVENYKQWEFDHIKPVARGGTNDLANRACACRTCNKTKLHFDPSEMASTREGRIQVAWEYIQQRNAETERDYLSKYREILRA
jgi:5-methylcytosine-specific restriction endonuclease McrA